MNLRKICMGLLALVCFSVPLIAQIESGRAIQITISGVPSDEKGRIDGMYPVSDSGLINMPFIGAVQASGLKNEQLAASLEARYRAAGIYTNPTVQVISNSGNSINEQTVVLGGQVRLPGPKAFTKGLTLWQAVQAAGGPTEFGSMKRVRLLRDGRQTEYDLTKVQSMGVPVQPNDAIEVPQKRIWEG